MSRFVRYHDGNKPSTYLNWHRQALPDECGVIDLDAVEYCTLCDTPLALVETAAGTDQLNKTVRITKRLAALTAGLPAWVVLYAESDFARTCDPRQECTKHGCDHGIYLVRYRMIRPHETVWKDCSPSDWSSHILRLHDAHQRSICQAKIGGTA